MKSHPLYLMHVHQYTLFQREKSVFSRKFIINFAFEKTFAVCNGVCNDLSLPTFLSFNILFCSEIYQVIFQRKTC